MKKNFLRRVFSISLVFFTFIMLNISTSVTRSETVIMDESHAYAAADSNIVSVTGPTFIHDYGIDTYEQVIDRYQSDFRNELGIDMGGVVYFPSFRFIDCYNYSQTALTHYYNNTYNGGTTNYGGTCSEVAIAIATDLVLRKDYNRVIDTKQIFQNVMDIAINNNWFPNTPATETTGPSGTNPYDIDSITSAVANYYGINKTVYSNGSYSNCFNILRNCVDNGYPVIISGANHSVVGVGYQVYSFDYTVEITHTILWWTYTEYETRTFTKNYLAVLDGWSYDNNTWIISGESSVSEQDRLLTYLAEDDLANSTFYDITYFA